MSVLETYQTKFSDFAESKHELIGKWVLLEEGKTYDDNLTRSLKRIERLTKTGFGLIKSKSLFDFNGNRKGLSSNSDMSTISRCILLTEDECCNIRIKWRVNRRKRELIKKIKERILGLTIEKLESIIVLSNHS